MKYLNKLLNIFTIDVDPNRIYGLDVLRAFAIIVVLYGHSRHFLEGHIDMDLYKLFLFDGVTGAGYIYKALTAISLISYSMYLINYTLVKKYFFKVLFIFIPELQSVNLISSIGNYLLFWFVTIVCSIVLYKYYEMPMTKLRDKI